MKGFFTASSLLLGLLVLASASPAQFRRIVVFGDSLSDMGNTGAATLGLFPGTGYFSNRFSNGNVWIERLAASLRVPLSRSGTGGTNWAAGGAESGAGTFGFLFIQIPNVTTQVTRYLNTNPSVDRRMLFVIWSGGNDYLNGGTNVTLPPANIEANIRALYGRGGRQFLVPNLPLLGTIPRHVGTPDEATFNAFSQGHNLNLSTRISALRSELPGIRIAEMNVAGMFAKVRANAAAYGFTNITGTALVNGTVAPNADQFLFFDDIHPTRRGHQILADLGYSATLSLLVPGR